MKIFSFGFGDEMLQDAKLRELGKKIRFCRIK
jgi:hypothetical protein